MKPSAKRPFLWMLPAVLLCLALFSHLADSSRGPRTDAEKRHKIDEMYADYRKDFPGVAEIEPKLAMDLMGKPRSRFVDIREPEEQAVSMLPKATPVKVYLKDPDKNRYLAIFGLTPPMIV